MDTREKSDSIISFELFGDGLVAGGGSASRPVRHIRLLVPADTHPQAPGETRPKAPGETTLQVLGETRPQAPVAAAGSKATADKPPDIVKQIDVEGHDLQPVKVAYILDVLGKHLPEPLTNLKATLSDDNTAMFTLNGIDMDSLERIETTLVDALMKISQNVKTVAHTFSSEKYTIAVKHFSYYFRRINTIKCYAGDELNVVFAYTTDAELKIVQQHVELISNQPLGEAEIQLDDVQANGIEGTRANLGEVCAATVSLHEGKLLIFGIREDVTTAILQLKKVLAGMVIKTVKLDAFAMKLVDRDPVRDMINDMSVITRWKLKLGLKDQTIYVVGKKDNQVECGVSALKDFFCKITVPVTRRERGSRGWDMFVRVVMVQCGAEIDIDDTDDGVVTICVTEPRYSQVVQHIEEKKSRWTLTNKRVVLTADICGFAMRHTKQTVMSEMDAEFLEFKQASDGKTIELTGTEYEVKAAYDAIKKVAQVVYGVPNERARIFLDTSGQDVADAVMKRHKVKAQIIVKEGRIEDENVDVIVNSTAYSLKLEQDAAAMTTAIYAKAGPKAQESIKDKTEELKRDHVVVGDPGNLQCKKLMHVALDEYDADKAAPQSKHMLARVIRTCLCNAIDGGNKTIAFPALCTGILKYPCSLVAETVVGELVRFFNSKNRGSIETVYIVIPKGDNSDKKGYSKKRIFDDEVAIRRRQADEAGECLVGGSDWIFHSRCELTLPSKDDAGRFANTMNERFKKHRPQPLGIQQPEH